MKSIALRLLPLAAFLFLTGAQAADKANLVRLYDHVVAPAQQQAYELGVKAFFRCLHQHGYKYAWHAWNHETGDTGNYSYVSSFVTWADVDNMRTSPACDGTYVATVQPHVQSEYSSFARRLPKLSHMSQGMQPTPKLMGVTTFTLKPGRAADQAFMHAVETLTAAANKANWPGHYMFFRVIDGGAGAPDYVLIGRFSQSWADYGTDVHPPFWKMVDGVYGKRKTAELRKTINDSIAKVEAHVDRYNAGLSYNP